MWLHGYISDSASLSFISKGRDLVRSNSKEGNDSFALFEVWLVAELWLMSARQVTAGLVVVICLSWAWLLTIS